MKVLLVFPPASLEERYSKDVGESGGYLPPMGLCNMAATLEAAGHEVRILDCPVNKLTQEDVMQFIDEFRPEMVGLAAITMTFERTKQMCRLIQTTFPSIFILVGGPHVTVQPQQTLDETGCNIALVGEADITIVEIANNIDKYTTPQIVQGEKVKDLDSLPYPSRHLLNMKKYTSLPNNWKKSPYVFQMFATRGCPYTCTFCAEAKTGFRQRSVEHVIGEIKQLQVQYGMQEVVFWDAVFTMNKKWVYEFCDALDREGIELTWTCYSRTDLLEPEMLRRMKEVGCWNMFFGIESGSQLLLDTVKKRNTLSTMRQGIRWVQEAGMEIRGSFILGLPNETPKLARETIDFAIALDPDYAQFSLATPFPGTELWNTWQEFGDFDQSAFDKFNIWNPVFLPKGYRTKGELVAMQKEAFRRFYFRPKYIWNRLIKVRTKTDIMRYLKGLRMVWSFARPA